jgi:ABC-type molybdate transport system permease subunit
MRVHPAYPVCLITITVVLIPEYPVAFASALGHPFMVIPLVAAL